MTHDFEYPLSQYACYAPITNAITAISQADGWSLPATQHLSEQAIALLKQTGKTVDQLTVAELIQLIQDAETTYADYYARWCDERGESEKRADELILRFKLESERGSPQT